MSQLHVSYIAVGSVGFSLKSALPSFLRGRQTELKAPVRAFSTRHAMPRALSPASSCEELLAALGDDDVNSESLYTCRSY